MLAIRTTVPSTIARYDTLRIVAESAVKQFCKWELEPATVTEYYDGVGYRDIPLYKPYVSAVASVYLDQNGYYGQGPTAFTGSALIEGQDYAVVRDGATANPFKSALLRRIGVYTGYLWPSDLVYNRYAGGLSYQKPPFWPAGYGNVKVTYTYGFAVIPQDIKLAVATAVGCMANSVKWGYPLTSESLGAHSVGMHIAREPEFGTVRQLLSRYRDTSI